MSIGNTVEPTIERLRELTRNTDYEGKLYLVGGLIRDRLLGLPLSNDLDLVLEGDAPALAIHLFHRGAASHYPVIYPRFGTAMVHLRMPDGVETAVELVTARAESYSSDSRKPDVRQASLREDVFRRDFTLNSLLENLHTGEMLDLTGRGLEDLRAGVIRTPLDPQITFHDDPLRMLRAVRFAARFSFQIADETWQGMVNEASRLAPPTISAERIRDEFTKMMRLPGHRARAALELLLESGLLAQFLPEALPMIGCTQGAWHRHDVWTHSLTAVEALPDETPVAVRLATFLHDIGKPPTREADENGRHIRFPNHATVGGQIARKAMGRLKYSNEEIDDVVFLVDHHMRFGEYRPEWSDAAIKRLIREVGPHWDDLNAVINCDLAAVSIPEGEGAPIGELLRRVDEIRQKTDATKIVSPLDGREIGIILNSPPGTMIGRAKDFLTNEVIEGRLAEGDKTHAEELLRQWAKSADA